MIKLSYWNKFLLKSTDVKIVKIDDLTKISGCHDTDATFKIDKINYVKTVTEPLGYMTGFVITCCINDFSNK